MTLSRIIFSPAFLLIFFLSQTHSAILLTVLLWIVFIIIELSDLFDGWVARKRNEVTDLGKLLDPFGDSVSRLTYFLAFLIAGYMPLWIFVLVLYRDLLVSFIRLLVAKRGVAMAARISGKVKAWIYAAAGIAGLVLHTVDQLHLGESFGWVGPVVFWIFVVTGFTAVWTMVDYSSVLRTIQEN